MQARKGRSARGAGSQPLRDASPIARAPIAFFLLVLAGLAGLAGLGGTPARGHGDEAHTMPTGSPNASAEATLVGDGKAGVRRVCSFRPGLHQPSLCGTAATLRPAPPLRGKMLMFEANSFTDVAPTANQQRASDEMVASCQASVAKHGWENLEVAKASGFAQAWKDTVHYVNTDFVFDQVFLDCDKPEYLMYYDTPTGKALAGIMFVTQNLLDEGPQFGGSATRWHFHYWASPRCFKRGVLAGLLATDDATLGECEEGELSFRSPEMLHVWLFDHPGGRFASMMHLSDEDLQELIGEKAAPATP